jgi:NitT/TauT family transport system ATP-binding protein
MLHLAGFQYHYPHQLSGGMQQRTGLARALSLDPSMLLMDEPFSALDAHTRELLQEELLQLWERTNKSVLFVTHSIDEAIYLADRIVVMEPHPGRVKEILDVDLPRPRAGYDARAHPKYTALRSHIWESLRHVAA